MLLYIAMNMYSYNGCVQTTDYFKRLFKNSSNHNNV